MFGQRKVAARMNCRLATNRSLVAVWSERMRFEIVLETRDPATLKGLAGFEGSSSGSTGSCDGSSSTGSGVVMGVGRSGTGRWVPFVMGDSLNGLFFRSCWNRVRKQPSPNGVGADRQEKREARSKHREAHDDLQPLLRSLRQRSEQYFTASQSLLHFLRQVKGRPQRRQVF